MAEDDERLATMIATELAGAGYDVVVAYDGYSALTLVLEEHFDALLTDLLMPGLTGDAVAERARRVHPDLPVLLMTASHGVDVFDLPWTAVIRKPFDLAALVVALDSATGASRDA